MQLGGDVLAALGVELQGLQARLAGLFPRLRDSRRVLSALAAQLRRGALQGADSGRGAKPWSAAIWLRPARRPAALLIVQGGDLLLVASA